MYSTNVVYNMYTVYNVLFLCVSLASSAGMQKSSSGGLVSVRALEVAMQQTELFLKNKDHEDIDVLDNVSEYILNFILLLLYFWWL